MSYNFRVKNLTSCHLVLQKPEMFRFHWEQTKNIMRLKIWYDPSWVTSNNWLNLKEKILRSDFEHKPKNVLCKFSDRTTLKSSLKNFYISTITPNRYKTFFSPESSTSAKVGCGTCRGISVFRLNNHYMQKLIDHVLVYLITGTLWSFGPIKSRFLILNQ